jgi:hypothetical protein
MMTQSAKFLKFGCIFYSRQAGSNPLRQPVKGGTPLGAR